MKALLSLQAVSKRFRGLVAVDAVSFDVTAGELFAVIGPNGAGKTTLFNCVSGVIPPQSGRVVFDGRDITGYTPHRITQRGLVRTFQIARGFPRLSVLENLMLYGARQPGETLWKSIARPAAVGRREAELRGRAATIARRLNLGRVANDPASALSGGQKKLLEIGRALMADPRIILLDEPIAGVNPTLANEIAVHLESLVREEGLTFLVIEHNMDMIARLCRPVVVMTEGRRLAQGSFAEVASDPRVQAAYMGERQEAS
jgi:branched-chain amino acid transport system ATP-binding protein/neutral amino acid transport system ATP-binding protein